MSSTAETVQLDLFGGELWRHCVPKQKSPAGPRSSLNFNRLTQA